MRAKSRRGAPRPQVHSDEGRSGVSGWGHEHRRRPAADRDHLLHPVPWLLRATWLAQGCSPRSPPRCRRAGRCSPGGGLFRVAVDEEVLWDRKVEAASPARPAERMIRDRQRRAAISGTPIAPPVLVRRKRHLTDTDPP